MVICELNFVVKASVCFVEMVRLNSEVSWSLGFHYTLRCDGFCFLLILFNVQILDLLCLLCIGSTVFHVFYRKVQVLFRHVILCHFVHVYSWSYFAYKHKSLSLVFCFFLWFIVLFCILFNFVAILNAICMEILYLIGAACFITKHVNVIADVGLSSTS